MKWQFPNQCQFTVRLLSLSGSLCLYCLLTLAVNMLRSFKISFGLALGAMGTSDSPLLSFYVLDQFNSWQCSVWHSSNSWSCRIVVLQNALFVLLECFCKLY